MYVWGAVLLIAGKFPFVSQNALSGLRLDALRIILNIYNTDMYVLKVQDWQAEGQRYLSRHSESEV